MNKTIRIALVGAKGQMGRAIVAAAKDQPNLGIAVECDVGDALEDKISQADVIIDFSHADTVSKICSIARRFQIAVVIGTTGHTAEQKRLIEAAGTKIPIVYASNFSVAVNVLFDIAAKASQLLGRDFNVRIVETHHTRKKDAPSGTAKTLAEVIKAARRTEEPVTIESIREGDVVGDHTVFLSGPGEELELTHRASSREIFALGALRAAQWVVDQKPGLYSMRDVLGL